MLDARGFSELSKLLRLDYFGNPQQAEMLFATPNRTFTLTVPADATDSYQGRLIEVQNTLTVTLETEGCCVTNPEASTLVEICRGASLEPAISSMALSAPIPLSPPASLDTAAAATATATAAAIPADWFPQTAATVEIPMVEATLLDSYPSAFT